MKIHIVQKGDTLWKIAKKYGADFDELKKLNAQLSNPEMIMPGMKIKVPTTGGMVKKETHTGHAGYTGHAGAKEMPLVTHPYEQMPEAKMPVAKEMPVPKEVPKAPAPKETQVKEKVVEKKETIYKPVMPQPVIPEIDIHNYYVTNMAEIETHTAAPPPKHHESESSESVHYTMPVKEECPEMYVPYNPCPPVMPVYDCGCGGGDMHAGFFPPPYSMPYPQVPYPMPYPMAYPQMPVMTAPTGFTQIPAMAAPAGFMPQQQPAWHEGQQVMPGYEWEEESSSSSPYPYGPGMQAGVSAQHPAAAPQWGAQQAPLYGAASESSAYMPQYMPPQTMPQYAPYPPHQKPCGCQEQPYGGVQEPYGMAPQPYGMQEPFGGMPQPPYGMSQPPYGMQEPYGMQAPFGYDRGEKTDQPQEKRDPSGEEEK
ncbi:spore coat protein [Heyndrickxia coagulans P38]|nr:SafA/ExsA family spore coat assembly protein [Heyndrickxia coagulans]KGT39846.1 spore coat protein [Heyndrickxia coagulans P38]NWN93005.1 SafA/ExsA family spore coat assembly protein [Bacillus sp. (in: firmicutes)]